jgi:hypothetical protein
VQHVVRYFLVKDAAPRPPAELTVEASSLDGARASARSRLEADGYLVRALTFGPTGLVACVEERAP